MAIFKDFESKQDIFDLIDKFDNSNLFELEISIPVTQPQCTKIKMMKLARDKSDGAVIKATVENGGSDADVDIDIIEENVKPKIEKTSADSGKNSKSRAITAPLVGTFYSSSSPDSEAYVKVGDKITKGMIICIIEAMKIMNEIESETDGEIAEVLLDNGSPVEYGQPLFRLK